MEQCFDRLLEAFFSSWLVQKLGYGLGMPASVFAFVVVLLTPTALVFYKNRPWLIGKSHILMKCTEPETNADGTIASIEEGLGS